MGYHYTTIRTPKTDNVWARPGKNFQTLQTEMQNSNHVAKQSGSFLKSQHRSTLRSSHSTPRYLSVLYCVYTLSCVQLFTTPWTAAHQAPVSMEYSSQEYQSGLPFPIPRDLPDPGIEPAPLASPAPAGRFFTTEPPG